MKTRLGEMRTTHRWTLQKKQKTDETNKGAVLSPVPIWTGPFFWYIFIIAMLSFFLKQFNIQSVYFEDLLHIIYASCCYVTIM